LTQNVGKQQFDTFGDAVQLKLRLTLDALHNQNQILYPNEKQTESAKKGRRHNNRFYPGIYFHRLLHWLLVDSYWSLVTGSWSLVPGHWSLVTGLWLLAAAPKLSVTRDQWL
jgi:hypothetical protein